VILIIFGKNISETTGYQIFMYFPTSPNVCFCTTWGNQDQQNNAFLLKVVKLLTLNDAQKHILFTFLTLWLTLHPIVSFFSFCNKIDQKLAHCANTDMEMISPFIHSSIDNAD